MRIYPSYSSRETRKLAAETALSLWPGKSARVIALSGELGSGKTTFVQGFMKALGYKGKVTSPTFVLMKRFPLKKSEFKNVFHMDAYRLNGPAELKKMGFGEIKKDPRNIVIVEWPENIGLRGDVRIKFEHGERETHRKIRL